MRSALAGTSFASTGRYVSKLVLPVTDGVSLGSLLVAPVRGGSRRGRLRSDGRYLRQLAGVVSGRLDRRGARALYALGSADCAGPLRLHSGDTVLRLSSPGSCSPCYALRLEAGHLVCASRHGLATARYVLASRGIVAALTLSAVETMHRNEVFGRSAEPYRALAEDLPRVVPEVAKGIRFIIYYGKSGTALSSCRTLSFRQFTRTAPSRR